MKYDFGFLGCGNMGSALIQIVAKNIPAQKIAVCDHNKNKTNALKKQLGVNVTNITELASESKYFVIGVKPQALQNALNECQKVLQQRKDVILITMLAGTPISKIQNILQTNTPTIRIMPSSPVLVNEGVILYCLNGVNKSQETEFLNAFANSGLIDKIEENKIDAASALSGCGPAYCYMFLQGLVDGAVECGIPYNKALMYATKTMLGSAKMVNAFGNPENLKVAVCSPGGTTIAGIHALKNAGFKGAVMNAVTSAYNKTLNLTK